MRHSRTIPPKRFMLVAALLFFGAPLLFPGCDIPAFQKLLCVDCPVSNLTDRAGTFNVQYLDCHENVKSTQVFISGFQVVEIDDCLRLIKTSRVSASE